MKHGITSTVAVLVAVALIGSIGATSLRQQVFATTTLPPDPCKTFKELVKDFQDAGLMAVGVGNPDEMQRLLDEFSRNIMMIFEVPPPDNDKC